MCIKLTSYIDGSVIIENGVKEVADSARGNLLLIFENGNRKPYESGKYRVDIMEGK